MDEDGICPVCRSPSVGWVDSSPEHDDWRCRTCSWCWSITVGTPVMSRERQAG
jgi:rubredoxin